MRRLPLRNETSARNRARRWGTGRRRHRAPGGSARTEWRRPASVPWRPARSRASARIRPCRTAPETGTNSKRGARSLKCGEPAVEHQQVPRTPELAAHRPAQHAALDEPRHRPLQHLPGGVSASGAPAGRSRTCGRSRWPGRQARLHELPHQQFAAAAAPIDQQLRVDAQHELHQPMIQQRRAHFQRMRHAGAVHLASAEPSARSVFRSSQRNCTSGSRSACQNCR